MREILRGIGGLAELVFWIDGGQRQARRNAWAAMAADTRRSRERAEVAAAVEHLNWPNGSRTQGLPG